MTARARVTANGLCRFQSRNVQEYRGTSWNINLPRKKLVVGKMMINHDKPIDFEVCPVCLDQTNHIRNAALRGFPHLQEAAIIRGCCLHLQKSGSTCDRFSLTCAMDGLKWFVLLCLAICHLGVPGYITRVIFRDHNNPTHRAPQWELQTPIRAYKNWFVNGDSHNGV